ncbi:MAG: hypothetical protein K1V80_03160 [Muribaculaceae bacterium]
MNNHSIAARFHFQNCSVTIKVDGEMIISRSASNAPGDVALDRNFTPEDDPTTFIGQHNEFYKFLSLTSTTNTSMILKCTAIGYMLCNSLPRGGMRSRSFVCCNEDEGACANGKSLFCRAIAELSNPAFLDGKINRTSGNFILSAVDEHTTVAVFDDIKLSQAKLDRFYPICPGEWRIARVGRPELILEREIAPYVLITTNTPAYQFLHFASAVRRFVPLEFSSFFSVDNPVVSHFGHALFGDWDAAQWHLFDNFMFYCVREYLHVYRNMIDPFRV